MLSFVFTPPRLFAGMGAGLLACLSASPMLEDLIVFCVLLTAFGAVLASTLFASVDAEAIERAAHDVVTDAGEVTNAAAANEDDGVLLKVVAFAADVGRDFFAVGEANARDLAERGVGLLGRDGAHLEADAAFLGALINVAHLGLRHLGLARIANKLINRRHSASEPFLGVSVSVRLGPQKSARASLAITRGEPSSVAKWLGDSR